MLKEKQITTVITKKIKCALDRKDILEFVRMNVDAMSGYEMTKCYFRVPSGGDHSNMDLEISPMGTLHGDYVHLEFERKETTNERQ